MNENPIQTSETQVPEAVPQPKRRGKLTAAERRELVELGPERFAEKHGYSKRALGIFWQLYRRLGGNEAEVETAASGVPASGPVMPSEMIEMARVPPLIRSLLRELPPAGTRPHPERIQALSDCFQKILAVVYGGD